MFSQFTLPHPLPSTFIVEFPNLNSLIEIAMPLASGTASWAFLHATLVTSDPSSSACYLEVLSSDEKHVVSASSADSWNIVTLAQRTLAVESLTWVQMSPSRNLSISRAIPPYDKNLFLFNSFLPS